MKKQLFSLFLCVNFGLHTVLWSGACIADCECHEANQTVHAHNGQDQASSPGLKAPPKMPCHGSSVTTDSAEPSDEWTEILEHSSSNDTNEMALAKEPHRASYDKKQSNTEASPNPTQESASARQGHSPDPSECFWQWECSCCQGWTLLPIDNVKETPVAETLRGVAAPSKVNVASLEMKDQVSLSPESPPPRL